MIAAWPASGLRLLIAPVVWAIIKDRLGGALQWIFFPVPFGTACRSGVQ
jgi:hypothetical protein